MSPSPVVPACGGAPCPDVVAVAPRAVAPLVDLRVVRIVLVSECAPADPADGYDAPGEPLFARTTLQAFREGGLDVATMGELRRAGVWCTEAVRCPKAGSSVSASTIGRCSVLLEQELARFPNVAALLLMGDVAIKAVNAIARRAGEPRPVPAGATYRIRGGDFRFRGMRVFPSYLQAGPAYFIEASKRRMIAEDIRAALAVAGIG